MRLIDLMMLQVLAAGQLGCVRPLSLDLPIIGLWLAAGRLTQVTYQYIGRSLCTRSLSNIINCSSVSLALHGEIDGQDRRRI
jgi:hypothetical protein